MKRVIVTGASDGLGREFAKICLENQVEVVCLSRSKPDYPCCYIKTDLSDENSIKASVEEIKAKYKKFDALVNCAGVIAIQPTEEIEYKEMEKLIKINVMGPMFLTSQLLDLIKENEADVFTVGSTAGVKGKAKECAYGASKWALQGISKSLQDALSKTRCRVTQFNPGGMKTKLFDKFKDGLVDTKDFMEPKDIAQIMFYILNLPKQIEVSEILINRK